MPLAFVRACTAQLARGFYLWLTARARTAAAHNGICQARPCVCPGGRRAMARRTPTRAYVCCRTRKPTPPRHASPAPTVCRHGAVPCSMRVQQQQRLALVCSLPAAQDPPSLFPSSVTGSRPATSTFRAQPAHCARPLPFLLLLYSSPDAFNFGLGGAGGGERATQRRKKGKCAACAFLNLIMHLWIQLVHSMST
jgi:hypothetical protein